MTKQTLSEKELKKALHDTLTRAAWYVLLLASQIARLVAIVVKINFYLTFFPA